MTKATGATKAQRAFYSAARKLSTEADRYRARFAKLENIVEEDIGTLTTCAISAADTYRHIGIPEQKIENLAYVRALNVWGLLCAAERVKLDRAKEAA